MHGEITTAERMCVCGGGGGVASHEVRWGMNPGLCTNFWIFSAPTAANWEYREEDHLLHRSIYDPT